VALEAVGQFWPGYQVSGLVLEVGGQGMVASDGDDAKRSEKRVDGFVV
jgi:hypothetical protein